MVAVLVELSCPFDMITWVSQMADDAEAIEIVELIWYVRIRIDDLFKLETLDCVVTIEGGTFYHGNKA
jgi:hypothetical protein